MSSWEKSKDFVKKSQDCSNVKGTRFSINSILSFTTRWSRPSHISRWTQLRRLKCHSQKVRCCFFSWEFGEGQTRYFLFTVLPLGLSSAPFIFTKLLKLETHWMSQGIATAIFLDDGVGAGSSLAAAKINSSLVRSDLWIWNSSWEIKLGTHE